MNKEVKYDFFYKQTNHHLVQQYFSLRTEAFIEQWGLKNFSGAEDQYDSNAVIIIAHKDGVCVGGARMIINQVGSNSLLPVETDKFRIANLLPELDLYKNKYAELSRIAMLKEYRNGEYSAEMYRRLIDVKARALGIDFLFCVTTMKLARTSRLTLRKLNLPFEIKSNLKVPDLPTYEGHKMVLSLIDLTKVSSTEYQEGKKVEDLIC